MGKSDCDRGCPALTTLDLSALMNNTGGTIYPNGCTALTTLDLSALVIAGSVSTIDLYTGNTTLANVTIGTIGTLKVFDIDLTLRGLALTLTSIDALLATFATLDGTNGTTIFVHTIDISGGTSAIPDTAGLASIATILANGGMVVYNTGA